MLEKAVLFQAIKSLNFVCYRASEAKDEHLQRLLRELLGAGVAVVDLDAYEDVQKLPVRLRETLLLAGSWETLALAENTPMATVGYGALVRDDSSRAPVGNPAKADCVTSNAESDRDTSDAELNSDITNAESDCDISYAEAGGDKERHVSAGRMSHSALPQADLLVEGFEEVDVQLLDRIMKRAQGLPWVTVMTKRCILREMTLDDLDELFELYAQPGITDYTEPLYERAEEAQYTRDYITHMYRFYGYGMWLVFSRESGALVGRAGFSHQDLGDEIVLEMGYIVGVPYQRQGYATEICKKLVEFARVNLSDFGTLNCFVEPGNAASHGLMGKLGFVRNGTVELQGKEMVRYEFYLSPPPHKV